MSFTRGTAVTGFPFGLVNATDGSAVTTGTATGYITKDGGTQAALTNTPVHEGNGQWSVDLTASEMDAEIIGLIFTHASAVNASFTINTWPAYSTSGGALGSGSITLDAVNELLESIGLPAVDALDTGGTSEEAEAELILDRVNTRVQQIGWAANTLTKVTYTPDGSSNIVFAGDMLRIRPVGASSSLKVSIRNSMLYDMENDVDTFDDDVELEIVELVNFEHLPINLRTYIIKAARVEFQRYKKRGRIDDAFIMQEMHAARVRAMQEDSDMRGINLLKTDEALRVKGNRDSSFTRYFGSV